jgi:hypothetical protein
MCHAAPQAMGGCAARTRAPRRARGGGGPCRGPGSQAGEDAYISGRRAHPLGRQVRGLDGGEVAGVIDWVGHDGGDVGRHLALRAAGFACVRGGPHAGGVRGGRAAGRGAAWRLAGAAEAADGRGRVWAASRRRLPRAAGRWGGRAPRPPLTA